jgi:hypothetical protein
MSKENQASVSQPQIVNANLEQLLGIFLREQATTNKINQQLLNIQLEDQEAKKRKDEEARAKLDRARKDAHDALQHVETNKHKRWANCSHKDARNIDTIWPISNHPDRLLHGVCTGCGMPVDPAHYEEDAYGKKTLVPEHPLYQRLLQRDREIYSAPIAVTSY